MVYLEIALITFGAGGLLYSYWSICEGLQKYRQNNAIKEHDPVNSADELEGEVPIVGTVVADDPLPIGSGECVAAEIEVWQGGLGDDNKYLADDTATASFAVETDFGPVPIEPDGIAVESSDSRSIRTRVAGNEHIPKEVQRYDDWAGLPEQPRKGKRDYTIDYIDVGDEVYLHGYAEPGDEEVVLTDHDGPFFVTDTSPETLVEERAHVLRKSLIKGLGQAAIGIGGLGAGVVALFV